MPRYDDMTEADAELLEGLDEIEERLNSTPEDERPATEVPPPPPRKHWAEALDDAPPPPRKNAPARSSAPARIKLIGHITADKKLMCVRCAEDPQGPIARDGTRWRPIEDLHVATGEEAAYLSARGKIVGRGSVGEAPATTESAGADTSPKRRMWPWVVGGLGTAAAVGVGVYFLRKRDDEDLDGDPEDA